MTTSVGFYKCLKLTIETKHAKIFLKLFLIISALCFLMNGLDIMINFEHNFSSKEPIGKLLTGCTKKLTFNTYRKTKFVDV